MNSFLLAQIDVMFKPTFMMELLYFVFYICVISNVRCEVDCNHSNAVILEKYAVYLIGFSMLFMFITIICLSIALYMTRNNKTIFGININNKHIYYRQESTQGVTVSSYANNVNDLCRNDESTHIVNSGTEVSGLAEPETPTRIDLKDERKPPCTKKHLMPIIPTPSCLQKAQMDDIIKQVLLNRRAERGSTTLRELDAFTNQKPAKEDEKETTFKSASTSFSDSEEITNHNHDETLYENLPAKLKKQFTNVVQTNQASIVTNSPSTERDGVDGFETHIKLEDEQEVYDTVPNPVRCSDGNFDNGSIESLPVYDCPPPRRSWEKAESSGVVLDDDTDYLLLLSKNKDDDKTSYINAKILN